MGGTVWPLNMVSGTTSSQSSVSLSAEFSAGISAANVDAIVASDKRE